MGSDLACHIIASDFTLFELHNINKASGAYSQGGLTWNFCQYLSGKEYFAAQGTQGLTGSDYIPAESDTVKEGDNIVGVSITRKSDDVCRTDSDGKTTEYQFTTIVKCDAAVTGAGNGVIQSVDTSDSCHPVVTMAHSDGCYEYTANSLIRWLSENPTVLGLVFLLVGPVIAMMGKRWFPYIAASIGAITVICGVMLLAGLFGFMSSWVWGTISLLVAVLVGVLFGMFLRRAVWTAVGITGAISGFLFGGFVYTLILQASGWKSLYGYWGLAVTFCVLFTVLSCIYGQQMVLLATSFFGSYLFVSGLNYVFGGSVGLVTMLAKIQDGEEVTFTASTYIYLVVFVCMFAFTTVWQFYKEQEHEELANHTKKGSQYARA